jgi:tetratricopeptide (TPR) repeat protein
VRDVIGRTIDFMKTATAPLVAREFAEGAKEAANAAAFARGDWQTAVTGYRSRLAAIPDDAEGHRRLGLALMELGRQAEALPALERAWELGRRGTRDTVLPAAVAAAGAGNVERAVYWLDLALATRFAGDPESYRTDPRFEKIRGDKAFIAVLDKHKR